MALLDAYATIAQFRARAGSQTDGDDPTLIAQLLSGSRSLERAMFLAPGAFNEHTATYTFVGHGGRRLRLRDAAGYGYFLQSVAADAIGVDWERDGSFDGYTWDFDDAWVRGLPENAAAASEPFHTIELLNISGAPATVWPDHTAAVQITSEKWGWPDVPNIIVDLLCHRVHEIRTGLKEGGLGAVPAFDNEATMRPNTAWMWKEAERLYGRYRPRSVAV